MVRTIAVLRESKVDHKRREVENRVALTPPLVRELYDRCPGIEVFIEKDAGAKIDFTNSDYEKAGAKICLHSAALSKDIIVGVKETKLTDFAKLRNNVWISYQHFAQSKDRTSLAMKTNNRKGTAFVALETMEIEKDGQPFFPCLAPMSEAAAKIIARHADEFALLQKKIISSGLPETGLHGLKTVVFGCGSVGRTAAEEFSQRGCEVTILEKNPDKIRYLEKYFEEHAIRFPKVKVRQIDPETLRNTVKDAFFLVSAMYTSGRKPEKIVTVDLLKTMVPGGCVYPVDIDQGGGVERVVETSILEPFDLPVIPGTKVFFFAPPNIPSMGARTASEALGTVLIPYIVEIIKKDIEQAAEDNPVIKSGINIMDGKIVHAGLAAVFPSLK